MQLASLKLRRRLFARRPFLGLAPAILPVLKSPLVPQ
jgi:hypothetical protein